MKKPTVKCFSCGTKCDAKNDYCYGCGNIVCVECALIYDHMKDGEHGQETKKSEETTTK
jgi:hypothetical protein